MMKSIALDRLKDSAVYALGLTILTEFITAVFWWHIPGKVVICMLALLDVTLTFVIYALLYTIERVLINAIRAKKTTRHGYISRATVCSIARSVR